MIASRIQKILIYAEMMGAGFELNMEVQAVKGFNIIATANNRDKGVNELSSALKRRFNTVILPVPDSMDEEIDIVRRRVESFEKIMDLPAEKPALVGWMATLTPSVALLNLFHNWKSFAGFFNAPKFTSKAEE